MVTTSKPIVFLSHSSRDEAELTALQRELRTSVANAVEFFQSSDGQSIPFGTNWVHRVERALDDAKLMIVFLSPNSARSQWVHFEAGYAYSKRIRVVPVGILGFDMNDLKPPLSLLQGFNVHGADGMNNIVALLNREFELSGAEAFSDSDFERVFGKDSAKYVGAEQIATEITDLQLFVVGGYLPIFAEIREHLPKLGLDFEESRGAITTFGAKFSHYESGPEGVIARIEHEFFQRLSPLLDSIAALGSRVEGYPILTVVLDDRVRLEREKHRLAGRLLNCGVRLRADGEFQLNDTVFSPAEDVKHDRQTRVVIERQSFVRFRVSGLVSAIPYLPILSLLFDRGVFWLSDRDS